MPYINESDRKRALLSPRTVGDLNYAITILVQQFMDSAGGLSYQNINSVMGVLECAKAEFYRRVAIPYEDKKIAANGDVYLRDYAPLPNEAMLEKALLSLADTPRKPAEQRHTCIPMTDWVFHRCKTVKEIYYLTGRVEGLGEVISANLAEVDLETGLVLCTDGQRFKLYLLSEMRHAVPLFFHVAATRKRGERTTGPFPPRSTQPQRDLSELARELNWGKPLADAMKAAETACRGTHDFPKVG